MTRSIALVILLALTACQSGGGTSVPGDSDDREPFAMIAPDEALEFTGTEPFWAGEVVGGMLTWKSPEDIDGTVVAVKRFAGRGGLSFSGTLKGEALDMTVTPGTCSDGMSDREYPFVVTVQKGAEVLRGCAWSDRHPFAELQSP